MISGAIGQILMELSMATEQAFCDCGRSSEIATPKTPPKSPKTTSSTHCTEYQGGIDYQFDDFLSVRQADQNHYIQLYSALFRAIFTNRAE
jgi:hypothetical protein